jgi:hypothetical protein
VQLQRLRIELQSLQLHGIWPRFPQQGLVQSLPAPLLRQEQLDMRILLLPSVVLRLSGFVGRLLVLSELQTGRQQCSLLRQKQLFFLELQHHPNAHKTAGQQASA